MGTSDAPPNSGEVDQAPDSQGQTSSEEEQPLDQGATAQEQATEAGPSFEDQQAQAAADQSPGEPQVVPEQRPQAFSGGTRLSDASQRLDVAVPPSSEDYDRANSDEAKQAAIENSRRPNLLVGQRVQIVGDHSEAGRMAYVLQVEYSDGIQAMLASSGHPEARFAEVSSYVLRTRDGRTDVLVATPDQVKPLDTIDGWGRGQI